jgi:hypothetical protein
MATQMSVDREKVADFKGKLLCITAKYDAPGLSSQFNEFVEKLSTKKTVGVQVGVINSKIN